MVGYSISEILIYPDWNCFQRMTTGASAVFFKCLSAAKVFFQGFLIFCSVLCLDYVASVQSLCGVSHTSPLGRYLSRTEVTFDITAGTTWEGGGGKVKVRSRLCFWMKLNLHRQWQRLYFSNPDESRKHLCWTQLLSDTNTSLMMSCRTPLWKLCLVITKCQALAHWKASWIFQHLCSSNLAFEDSCHPEIISNS